MKKILISLLLLASSHIFAAPCPSSNGCTNVNNPNSAHLYFDQDVHLSSSPSSALNIDDLLKGSRPYPTKTQAERDAILSPEIGLIIYNTDSHTLDYFDGAIWQVIVSIDHLIAGSNISLVDNGNGTVTINAAGSGGATTQARGAFTTLQSTAATTSPLGVFTAIAVDPAKFTAVSQSNTSVATATIDSVSTPIIVNTAAGGTRDFKVTFDVGFNPSFSNGQVYTFAIAVKPVSGAVQYSSFQNVYSAPTITTTGSFKPISVSGLVSLNTNDYVYLVLKSDQASQPIVAYTFNGVLVDTTVANLPSTDALIQGTQNKYLSQNGGANLASATGSITTGHVAQFIGTSGLVEDSGISSSTVVSTTNSFNPFSAVVTDGSSKLSTNSTVVNATYAGLGLTNSGSPLVGNSYVLNFGSAMQYGNYINFGSFGPFLGIDSNQNGLWISGNLIMNAPSSGFNYFNTAGSGMLRVDQSGVRIQHAVSGTGGNPATLVTDLSDDILGNINFPTQTASRIAVFDSSKNLVSGSAGTTTTLLHGNAAGVPTYSAVSLTNDVTGTLGLGNGGLNFTTATTGDLVAATGTNALGKISAVAAGSVLTSNGTSALPVYSATPTLSTLTLNNGGSVISGTNSVLAFSSGLVDGDYINFGGNGRNIGRTSVGNGPLFMSFNLNWDATVDSYKYVFSSSAAAIEVSNNGIDLKYAASGTGGNVVTPTTALRVTNAGEIKAPLLLANGILSLDSNSNIISTTSSTSWTPTIGDGTNNFTTSSAVGAYHRIGPLVFANAQIIWTGKGSASAGSSLTLSLPVVSPSAAAIACSLGFAQGIGYTGSNLMAYIFPATSTISLAGFSNTGTGIGVLVSNAATSGNITYSCVYSAV